MWTELPSQFSYHFTEPVEGLKIWEEGAKAFTENWVSKQSCFVLILKPVHSWIISYLFRNKTFLFFKIESWDFQHLFKKGISWNLTKFQLNQTTDKQMEIKIVWMSWMSWNFVRFHKFFLKQRLKVSVFYFEKQKSFNLKNKFFRP